MRIFSIAFFNAVLCNLPRMIVGVCMFTDSVLSEWRPPSPLVLGWSEPNLNWIECLFVCFLFSLVCQLAHHPSFSDIENKKPPSAAAKKGKCPEDSYGPQCACFEDDTAYFGNNDRAGNENPQPSRHACQQSCQHHPSCKYWTWGKSEPTGPCYLKTKRENVGYNLTSYVSGNKFCKLPEADAQGIYTSSWLSLSL